MRRGCLGRLKRSSIVALNYDCGHFASIDIDLEGLAGHFKDVFMYSGDVLGRRKQSEA